MMSKSDKLDGKFELTFYGSAVAVKFPRHRRFFPTFDAAQERACTVLALLENRAAHPAIIYGPGCGRDGVTIA